MFAEKIVEIAEIVGKELAQPNLLLSFTNIMKDSWVELILGFLFCFILFPIILYRFFLSTLLSNLMCCLATELVLGFYFGFFCFIYFPNLPPPPPIFPAYRSPYTPHILPSHYRPALFLTTQRGRGPRRRRKPRDRIRQTCRCRRRCPQYLPRCA